MDWGRGEPARWEGKGEEGNELMSGGGLGVSIWGLAGVHVFDEYTRLWLYEVSITTLMNEMETTLLTMKRLIPSLFLCIIANHIMYSALPSLKKKKST